MFPIGMLLRECFGYGEENGKHAQNRDVLFNPVDHPLLLTVVYDELKCDVSTNLNVTTLGNCLVLLLFMTSYTKQCLVTLLLIQEE